MPHSSYHAVLALCLAAVLVLKVDYCMAVDAVEPRPNVIFVLADDLGYGDVGWTVQNKRKKAGEPYIATPYMDQMVREGCELTDHYAAAPVCAPARASLLTGQHQGRCSLRDNSFDSPILETRTLATAMKSLGYATYAIGKWGIGGGGESGLPRKAHPLDRGFDHFYGFLDHMAGHTYYHYDGSWHGIYMGVHEDRERKSETAVGIYSTDLFMARAKKVLIDQTAENARTGTRTPVFMYLAINAMHGSGADKLDASVPTKMNLHVPGRAYPAYNGTSFGAKGGANWAWLQANREETALRNTFIYDYARRYDSPAKRRYSTTITRLDEAMQDLKQTLIDLGLDKNTIVIFSSDNGPAKEYGANPDFFDSNGAFQGMKRSCLEGGLRVPTFIWAPGFVRPGTVDRQPSMSHAWLAFIETLAKTRKLPKLSSEVYTEYCFGVSQIMTRLGDYVGVSTRVTPCTLDAIPLRVYDVVRDPSEAHDLSATPAGKKLLPKLRAALSSCHTKWERPDGFGTAGGQKETVRPYDK